MIFNQGFYMAVDTFKSNLESFGRLHRTVLAGIEDQFNTYMPSPDNQWKKISELRGEVPKDLSLFLGRENYLKTLKTKKNYTLQ